MVQVFVRVMLALALLAGTFSDAAELQPPKGSLVIIGGALRADNAAVWERIVTLPLFPAMTDVEHEHVVAVVQGICERHRRRYRRG